MQRSVLPRISSANTLAVRVSSGWRNRSLVSTNWKPAAQIHGLSDLGYSDLGYSDALAEPRDHAMWLGRQLPLDLSIFTRSP